MSHFVLRTVPSGFKFDLYAPNGQGILTSEVYDSTAACRRGMESVRKNAPAAHLEDQTQPGFSPCTNPKFELYRDRLGRFRFRLKARNGQIIGISQEYLLKTGALTGIESVRKNAPVSEVQKEI